jgi:hypothetical protein
MTIVATLCTSNTENLLQGTIYDVWFAFILVTLHGQFTIKIDQDK